MGRRFKNLEDDARPEPDSAPEDSDENQQASEVFQPPIITHHKPGTGLGPERLRRKHLLPPTSVSAPKTPTPSGPSTMSKIGGTIRVKPEPGTTGRVKTEPGSTGKVKAEPGTTGRILSPDTPSRGTRSSVGKQSSKNKKRKLTKKTQPEEVPETEAEEEMELPRKKNTGRRSVPQAIPSPVKFSTHPDELSEDDEDLIPTSSNAGIEMHIPSALVNYVQGSKVC